MDKIRRKNSSIVFPFSSHTLTFNLKGIVYKPMTVLLPRKEGQAKKFCRKSGMHMSYVCRSSSSYFRMQCSRHIYSYSSREHESRHPYFGSQETNIGATTTSIESARPQWNFLEKREMTSKKMMMKKKKSESRSEDMYMYIEEKDTERRKKRWRRERFRLFF